MEHNERAVQTSTRRSCSRQKQKPKSISKKSGLNWTILRPCGLADGESNAYTLTQNAQEIPQKYMTRNGLAAAVAAIVGQADSKCGNV